MTYKVKMNNNTNRIVLNKLQTRMQEYAADVEANMIKVMKHLPQPSRPGHPPRIDTANLVLSITSESRRQNNKIKVRVGTNVDYGLYLELGTEKMVPRPWIRQALRKTHRNINRI